MLPLKQSAEKGRGILYSAYILELALAEWYMENRVAHSKVVCMEITSLLEKKQYRINVKNGIF